MLNPSPKTKLVHITTVPMSLNFLRGQIAYMKQRGLEVYVISSSGEFLDEFARNEQVQVYSVEMLRKISPVQDLLSIWKIWKYLKQINPQIVHASTPKGGLLGIISAWLAHIPVRIYHIRGLPLMTAKGYKRWLLWLSEKVACSLAHEVLCVSKSIRDVAINEGLSSKGKIKVLLGGSSNGVDSQDKFNPQLVDQDQVKEIRTKYKLTANHDIVIGFVGRIVKDKGIQELVEAWKILREDFSNLHLLVVGFFEDQDSIPLETKQILEEDPRIHLTGMNWNTPPFYAIMDLLVLPTYREGFPNTPLEAAAMELPVIATKIPGCIDAVEDQNTGTLVPVKDHIALTKAIRTYLQDSQLRKKHGKAGRERVIASFQQEDIWEAVYQEYDKMIENI